IVGFSLLSVANTSYNAFYFVTLKPWEERTPEGLTADVIMRRLNQRLAGLPEAEAFGFAPPAIPGIGTSGGATFMLEDRSGQGVEFLAQNTERFLQAARQRPEFALLTTTFIPTVPQVFADVDRDKVLKQGVDVHSVYETLQAFMGGLFVNYFNRFGRVWQVYVQAEGEFRTQAENVGLFRVRNGDGQTVPLSTMVTMKTTSGPEFTNRFNGYRAAQINGILAPGYSSAQARQALEEVFAQTMPPEMGYDYSGMSFQEQVASQGVPASAIFGLSLLFVFLILAAQYESWSLPFSVLLTTPVAVFGAFTALWLRAFENNVYAQIGLVMLIGLSAKNAILIVEFAKVEFEGGKSIMDAALAAARLRLRPILMTAFAFILGVLPLAIASGAGAVGRQIMGTAVIGGMLAASVIAIFLIPVSFYVVERVSHRREAEQTPAQQPIPATK
ncbi:MAG TPA: efflux RND transporter permease subunit, partial [Blastocatellia bacterium]|nr:efflux RND transporter permease subunit [Blastocatellia bacterium]